MCPVFLAPTGQTAVEEFSFRFAIKALIVTIERLKLKQESTYEAGVSDNKAAFQ